jgi:type VI secretion system ImpM family protein
VGRAFLFGKLPAHGDFIARGLEPGERDALDRWLSEELAETRAALGPEFQERYDAAPPWRFAGPDEAGALAPSVDAAGRRFPLMVGVRAATAGEDTAAGCETLLYDALGEGWDADRLLEEAERVTADEESPKTAATWWTLGGEGHEPATLGGARPAGLFRAMLGQGATDR